jgi:hypothetical protein
LSKIAEEAFEIKKQDKILEHLRNQQPASFAEEVGNC